MGHNDHGPGTSVVVELVGKVIEPNEREVVY